MSSLRIGMGLAFLAAAPAAQAQSVGIYGAVSNPAFNLDVRDAMLCTQEFTEVQYYDVSTFTPDINHIQNFHSVLVYADKPFADPVAFGDVLAQYIEEGGGVVFAAGTFGHLHPIQGRVVTDGMMPVNPGTLVAPGGNLGIVIPIENQWLPGQVAGHQLVYGADFVDLGVGSVHVDGASPVAGAESVATWTNGQEGIVAYEPGDSSWGGVVAANLFPPSSVVYPNGWVAGADRILSQSLLWTHGAFKPSGTCENTYVTQDINCNGIDLSEEYTVDVNDPLCAANLDPATGLPYDSVDYYYNYYEFGCTYFVGDQDVDGDLLVGFDPLAMLGMVSILTPDGNPASTAVLKCDNCLYSYNPDQFDIDCDDVGDLCDNCVYVPNDQQNNDGDCWGDACDNCWLVDNIDQSDLDFDGVGDACDTCIFTFDPNQSDADQDFFGDACDNCPGVANSGQGDSDFDGVGDFCDNCTLAVNPAQDDADLDGIGDTCDVCPYDAGIDQSDSDGDGVGDLCDNCPTIENADQEDGDLDEVGNPCDNCVNNYNADQRDSDQDFWGDTCDVCPIDPDPDQEDADSDRAGDVCDNCPDETNVDQADLDVDGWGDACDTCVQEADPDNLDQDFDTVGDVCDNCPGMANVDQADEDVDGKGDACDIFAIRGGGGKYSERTGCDTGGASGLLGLALGMLALRRRRVEA